jgi:hypothetical protein
MIAPTAFHCFAHTDGEVGTALGATEAQCIYMYNWLYATMSEEKVLETTGKFLFFLRCFNPFDLRSKVFAHLFKNTE